MINLLVGAPGGGKSYEALVYHILPALSKGRKVITNLALNVAAIATIEPGYIDLIELRKGTLAERPERDEKSDGASRFFKRLGMGGAKPWNGAAFSHVEDYGDPWRHVANGTGALYVIDECHISLPKIGTPVDVEEWYSLHRHEFADVLLISQSYGKLNAAVRDLVQVVYRVRKNVALGSNKSYTRKVQDGIRGAVVNTAIRRYEPKFYSYYISHTKSGVGQEMGASDIIPLWRHWSVWGFFFMVAVFLALVWFRGNPFHIFGGQVKPGPVAGKITLTQASGTLAVPGVPTGAPVPAAVVKVPVVEKEKEVAVKKSDWPYGALELHVGGFIKSATKTMLVIVFSQNGQLVFTSNNAELERAGYKVTAINDCLVRLEYKALSQFIACDVPTVRIGDVRNGTGVSAGGSRESRPGGGEGLKGERGPEPLPVSMSRTGAGSSVLVANPIGGGNAFRGGPKAEAAAAAVPAGGAAVAGDIQRTLPMDSPFRQK